MSGKMFYALSTLIAFVLAFGVFIRFNPVDAGTYHRQVAFTGNSQGTNSFGVEIPAGTDPQALFERAALMIADAPRTRPLAGDPAQGHVSFVTSSRVWGFPDVTNLWLSGESVFLHGQAVFGKSDLGVNRARLTGWRQALAQGG